MRGVILRVWPMTNIKKILILASTITLLFKGAALCEPDKGPTLRVPLDSNDRVKKSQLLYEKTITTTSGLISNMSYDKRKELVRLVTEGDYVLLITVPSVQLEANIYRVKQQLDVLEEGPGLIDSLVDKGKIIFSEISDIMTREMIADHFKTSTPFTERTLDKLNLDQIEAVKKGL